MVPTVDDMLPNSHTPSDALSDQQLLVKYQQTSDLEVLGQLYQRYMHLVYGVCLKYLKQPEDSKDAVMQIFEHLIEKVGGQEIDNFKSWLYVVSKNHCLMHLRKQSRQREQQEKVSDFMETEYQLHPNGETEELDLKKLRLALQELPEHQKICLELFYYDDKSYQDISEATGFDIKKVKSYIQNGKRRLKGLMDRE